MLTQPVAVALRVGAVLDELGIDWFVGGSVASSLHGIPRATQDIDLVADLRLDHVRALSAALADGFYADPDLMREAIFRRASFNILEYDTVTKVDIFVVRRDARARSEMQRRQRYPVEPGGPPVLPLATPEDTIISKLDWYRRGQGTSDTQWRDVLGVIQVNAHRLDVAYLTEQAALSGVADLLEEALGAQH